MTEVKRLDLGAVSAYALAVEKGYKGTEEEFVEILTNALNYAIQAQESASAAAGSAEEAGRYKTQAQESASAAAGSAEEAGRYKTQAGEILASVNLAGTQQIEAIESAGTQQTNAAKEAIEAKGKETLDSIPDSYEALQGDVTQLRGDLGLINDDIVSVIDFKLLNGFDKDNTQGGYYNTTGEITASSSYTSSLTYARVKPNTDYQAFYGSMGKKEYTVVCWYDSSFNFISRVAGVDLLATSPSNAKYCRVSVPAANIATTVFVEGAVFAGYNAFGYALSIKDDVNIGDTETNQLAGKKIAVTGDSIAYGEGYTGGYAKIIAEDNNMTVQNIAVSGGTIVNKDGAFCISESIENMDSDADYAIVEGGFNDAASSTAPPLGEIASGYNAQYDTTTFAGAFETMLRNLVLRYEGKKYGYIAVHQATDKFRIGNDEANSYYWMARKCCEKWGVPFLDLNANVPAFGFFTATNADMLALRNKYTKDGDGIHPNEEGYRKYYVPKIEAWLKTL